MQPVGVAMIEKPEQAIGTHTQNNILVAGKQKLSEQHLAYKRLIEKSITNQNRQGKIYQCTEDQSKFSENDNTGKYEVYIRNNISLPPNVRRLQLACLRKLKLREHLIKRLP